MKIKVTVSIPSDHLHTLRAAVAHKAKPRAWRKSEYAMTKATAARLVKRIWAASPEVCRVCYIEADYFDWSCLLGEVARLWKWSSERESMAETTENIFRIYRSIRQQLMADPRVERAEAEAASYEKESRRLERARKRLDALEEKWEKQSTSFARRNRE